MRPKTALALGVTALLLPALVIAVIWAAGLDKDYGLLAYGVAAVLAVPTALIAGVLALRGTRGPNTPSAGRRQAWAGLILGLLAACLYVLGGLACWLLLHAVLRHD